MAEVPIRYLAAPYCRAFNDGEEQGYYKWNGLRYFLYEYELSLMTGSRQQKVSWDDLLKTPKDKISIEHILPQTSTEYWDEIFEDIDENQRGKVAYLCQPFIFRGGENGMSVLRILESRRGSIL